jgi:hypothetical protein
LGLIDLTNHLALTITRAALNEAKITPVATFKAVGDSSTFLSALFTNYGRVSNAQKFARRRDSSSVV